MCQPKGPQLLCIILNYGSQHTQHTQMARSIGQGVQFLNRHLSAAMFSGGGGGESSQGKTQLFEFLRTLKHKVCDCSCICACMFFSVCFVCVCP